MSYRVPDPIDWKLWAMLAFVFIGMPLIIAAIVYMHYAAPCSWWSGSPITEVPARCIEELRTR